MTTKTVESNFSIIPPTVVTAVEPNTLYLLPGWTTTPGSSNIFTSSGNFFIYNGCEEFCPTTLTNVNKCEARKKCKKQYRRCCKNTDECDCVCSETVTPPCKTLGITVNINGTISIVSPPGVVSLYLVINPTSSVLPSNVGAILLTTINSPAVLQPFSGLAQILLNKGDTIGFFLSSSVPSAAITVQNVILSLRALIECPAPIKKEKCKQKCKEKCKQRRTCEPVIRLCYSYDECCNLFLYQC